MNIKTKKYIDANWLLTLIQLLPHNGDMISSTEVEETIVEMMNNEEDYIEIKQDQTKKTKICPFCGSVHIFKEYHNIFCQCGGKYYFYDNSWLNRQTREENKYGNK